MENTKSSRWLGTTRGVHEFYLGIIAVTLIIALASIRWYAIPKLEELFGFALTVSSLVLAIVAIIYSIYSNASVEGAVTSLSAAVTSIPTTTIKLEDSSNRLAADVHRLTELTDGLNTQMLAHHEELRTELRGMSSQLVAERALPARPNEVTPQTPMVPHDAQKLLSATSRLGIQALMVVAHAATKSIPVKYKEKFEGTAREYVFGFLIATYSMDVFEGKVSAAEIRVSSTPLLYSQVRQEYLDRIETERGEPDKYKRLFDDFQKFERKLLEVDASTEEPAQEPPA